jgi:hypothetical protein
VHYPSPHKIHPFTLFASAAGDPKKKLYKNFSANRRTSREKKRNKENKNKQKENKNRKKRNETNENEDTWGMCLECV